MVYPGGIPYCSNIQHPGYITFITPLDQGILTGYFARSGYNQGTVALFLCRENAPKLTKMMNSCTHLTVQDIDFFSKAWLKTGRPIATVTVVVI